MATTKKQPAKKAAPRKAAAPPDAITLLRADHAAVSKMFATFDKMKADGPKKAALVKQICDELKVHTSIEEEIFYPAARQVLKDEDLMDEADVEHDGAKGLIGELEAMKPGDDHYDA
jgi:hemerythrin superfamily protein